MCTLHLPLNNYHPPQAKQSLTPSYFSPVDVGHVLHHEPPQVLVEVGEAGESPLQDLRVLGVQQRGDQNKEVGEVGVEVGLQVSGQLHHQAGGRKRGHTSGVTLKLTAGTSSSNNRDNLLQQWLVGQTVLDSQVRFQTLHYRLLMENQHVERLAVVGNLLQKCSCGGHAFISHWPQTHSIFTQV